MRKFIAILILVILMGALYMYTGNINESKENDDSKITDSNQLLKDLQEDYIGAVEEIHELQQTPDQVIKLNNMIIKKMYSGTISEEEIELLLNIQREIYDQELLDKNPKDIHFQRGKDEVKKFNDNNVKIIGYDSLAPEFSGDKNDNAIIKVVFYLNTTSSEGEIYEEYLLTKDINDKWNIKGWIKAEEFTVVGD